MTFGLDLVAKARSAASKRNSKIGVPKPYQTSVVEGLSSKGDASLGVVTPLDESSLMFPLSRRRQEKDHLRLPSKRMPLMMTISILEIPFLTTTHSQGPIMLYLRTLFRGGS